MLKKTKPAKVAHLPTYRVTVRKLTEKIVEGVATYKLDSSDKVNMKRITSDNLNSWEMFSVLTSWLHAQATKIKQEERIQGLKLIDFPEGEENNDA